MINLQDYLDPVSIDRPGTLHISEQSQFARNLTVHTENYTDSLISGSKVAILGLPEERMSPLAGTAAGPDAIRRELYPMSRIPGKLKIADLGNMKQGVSFGDTLAALTDLLLFLREHNIFPVLIGGTSALIPAIDELFRRRGEKYTLTCADSRIDYSPDRSESDCFNYLGRLLKNDHNSMSHFINVGYQTYLNDPQVITRLKRNNAELMRVGDVRQAIHQTEPLFRDSDVALFDIGVVRQSDAPGSFKPSPNGLYGEEACLLARYAGVSDKLKIFGLFEVNTQKDISSQTASLAAQMIWFFLESFAQKQHEDPADNERAGGGRFTRYHINVSDLEEEMLFVKSNFTERWWMEMVLPSGGSMYVACSYEDYLKANRDEVPDRWIAAGARIRKESAEKK